MAILPISGKTKRQRHARIQKVLSEGVQFLVDEGKEDPNTTKSGPSSIKLRLVRADNGPTWNAGSVAF